MASKTSLIKRIALTAGLIATIGCEHYTVSESNPSPTSDKAYNTPALGASYSPSAERPALNRMPSTNGPPYIEEEDPNYDPNATSIPIDNPIDPSTYSKIDEPGVPEGGFVEEAKW